MLKTGVFQIGTVQSKIISWKVSPFQLKKKIKLGLQHKWLFFLNLQVSLLDKVMSRNQWHIGIHQHHIMFKGLMQLNYNVLVLMYFYPMTMFQFA